MAKDFTLIAYKELLDSLMEANYKIITIQEYFALKEQGPFVVLRHDVDRRSQNAHRMAELETTIGIRSTYYFRRSTFNEHIILDLAQWGHEIGYHYEVMDKAKGDIGLAHSLFNSELERLRCWVPVKTCAAHGNPLTMYNNREFFDYFDPEQFGLVGEAEKVEVDTYYTDTGRGIRICNFKDTLDKGMLNWQWSYVAQNERNLCYNIHPERWNDGLGWYRQWVFDWGCNMAKRCLRARIAH
jgi:hypothetical protein